MARTARVDVELGGDEQAVVLVERDGVFSWTFPGASGGRTGATRGASGSGVRRATFEIELHWAPATAPRRPTRGLGDQITDAVVGKVRAVVLKFVAKAVGGKLIQALEKEIEPRLVPMRAGTQPRAAQADAPRRILLFVPGTFGGLEGSFSALEVYSWGRELVDRMHDRYDAVLGFEHRTLSEDPRQNAADLLRLLQAEHAGDQIDILAYSRGGLVARSLLEYELPGADAATLPALRHLVLVACPNAGTPMADAKNWTKFIDVYTNLATLLMKALALVPQAKPAAETLKAIIKSVSMVVKAIATASLDDDVAPGLAAMRPDGPFVTDLNATQPGQPAPREVDLYAVTATFEVKLIGGGRHEPPEFPRRLALALFDGLIDQLIKAPNDLIVDTPSMTAVDPHIGGFFTDVLDFGETPNVNHLTYFALPEVSRAIRRWLVLDDLFAQPPITFAEPALPAVIATDVVAVRADLDAERVRDVLAESDARYVVVRDRNDLYVYQADEVADAVGGYLDQPLGDALELAGTAPSPVHEGTSEITGRVLGGSAPEPASRHVVVAGSDAIGVVAGPPQLDAEGLAAAAASVLQAAPVRRGSTRGGATLEERPSAPDAAPEPEPRAAPPVLAHVRAEMPTELVLDKTATVTVDVSRETLAAAAGPAQAGGDVELDAARKLILQCVPKANVEVEGDARIELDIPAPGAPQQRYFDIRATHEGRAEVWIVARQGSLPLLTLRLEGRIVPEPSGGPPTARVAEAEVAPGRPEDRNLPRLSIYETEQGSHIVYLYDLFSPTLNLARTYRSKPIKGDRNSYIGTLYRRIEEQWAQSSDDVVMFQKLLRAFGMSLLDELVPPEVQAALWENREKIDGLLVTSEEPFIPWELVHLKEPGASRLPEDTIFLGQLGLTRWLVGRPNPHFELPPLELRVRAGRARTLTPAYVDPELVLNELPAEAAGVTARFAATPVEAHMVPLQELLEGPAAFDLLHFAGHGLADLANIQEAQILLEGRVERGAYVREVYTADLVKGYANLAGDDGNAPIVVLNACQAGRLGERLTSIGGFAEAFLAQGAGAFVSSLWSVGDEPARTFVEGFYDGLLDGKTVAQATQAARETARDAGDATWLAYVVYAHPSARLVRS